MVSSWQAIDIQQVEDDDIENTINFYIHLNWTSQTIFITRFNSCDSERKEAVKIVRFICRSSLLCLPASDTKIYHMLIKIHISY